VVVDQIEEIFVAEMACDVDEISREERPVG
jgi:hypothetical protein